MATGMHLSISVDHAESQKWAHSKIDKTSSSSIDRMVEDDDIPLRSVLM